MEDIKYESQLNCLIMQFIIWGNNFPEMYILMRKIRIWNQKIKLSQRDQRLLSGD